MWLIGGTALATIAYFDIGPALPFNDDWLFTWAVGHLSFGNFHFHPLQGPVALVQILWAAAVTFGQHDQRLLRLSELPFVALTAVSSFRLARRLGAERFWALTAGVALMCVPVYATLAASFMSDVPYIALVMASLAAAASWIKTGREGRLACVIFTSMAILQRQFGVMLPIATLITLVLISPRNELGRQIPWLLALVACSVAAAALPLLLGLATADQSSYASTMVQTVGSQGLTPLLWLPAMLGMSLLPLSIGVFFLRPRFPPARSAGLAIPLLLAGGAAMYALAIVSLRLTVFPGNVWTRTGLTSVTLDGPKTPLFSLWQWLLIEAVSLLSCALVMARMRDVSRRELGPAGLLVLVASAGQLFPLFLLSHGVTYDRYYLPVVAPLIPLAAFLASHNRRPRVSMTAALATMIVGLAVFFLGEQDYQAWQMARHEAALIAYRIAPPEQVQAGYESNAQYVELPRYEQTGVGASGASPMLNAQLVLGPAHPRVRLIFAAPDDPRPGVSYGSIVPGRVVVIVEQA